MNIRRASEKDIDSLIKLLQEVLEIHAAIRPDIFISGTTKYTRSDLLEKLANDEEPIYVAVDENDEVMGYASLPTWFLSNHFISMICALIATTAANISASSFSNMLKLKQSA